MVHFSFAKHGIALARTENLMVAAVVMAVEYALNLNEVGQITLT